MNKVPLSNARDEDARHIEAALVRAARRARVIAAQTRTRIVIVRNGKLVRDLVEPFAEDVFADVQADPEADRSPR
ncbi:MAG TPA: hypothetical protein PL024_03245 [Thauera sp.]|jgi:hypothetical protein|nr:hypothetical protein [Thauera sp.]HRA80494.1 hypothetical protein [Thauera sp.]